MTPDADAPAADAPALVEVAVPDDPRSWEDAGFVVQDGRVRLGPLAVRLGAPEVRLGFDGHTVTAFGGIPTEVIGAAPSVSAEPHPNGVDGFDHVVIMATDLDGVRTTLADAGLGIRRERPTRLGGSSMTQVFAFAGSVLLEIVAPSEPQADPVRGPLFQVWGFAANSADLDATVAWFDRHRPGACSPARPAVQPGRSIATVRRAMCAMALELAIMSPRASSKP